MAMDIEVGAMITHIKCTDVLFCREAQENDRFFVLQLFLRPNLKLLLLLFC